MKAKDVKVGGHYTAKVSGRLTTIRVDTIREQMAGFRTIRMNTVYDVVNLRTGRKLTFRSPQKFRGIALSPETIRADVAHAVERANR